MRRVRSELARVFLQKDSLQEARRIIDAERSPLAWSEVGLLLTYVSIAEDKSSLIENLKQSLRHQPGVPPATRGQAELLRCRFFMNEPGDSLGRAAQMVKAYPHDFLAHYRFALTSHVYGKYPKDVDASLRAVDKLTNSHPIALEMWAVRNRIPNKEEQKNIRLWEQRRLKAMISLKLRDYSRKLVNPSYKTSAETLSWANYLRKKGFTPPEPTAAQYAAVKKRGWAFNKQMLEPFRRIK